MAEANIEAKFIYNAQVLRVIDGDTYELMIDMGFNTHLNVNLRLHDEDTPETWRPSCEAEKLHGEQATEFVKERIEGREVVVDSKGFGKYRWTGLVYFIDEDGVQKNLSAELRANSLLKLDSYE